MASTPEQFKQAVITLMRHISTANGYSTNIGLINEEWLNPEQLDDRQIPALYVTNDAEDGDLVESSKFSSRCKIEEDITIVIFGTVRAKLLTDVPERLVNALVFDIKKAIARDLELNGLADQPKGWSVRRVEPWAIRGKTRVFQVSVTYQARIDYSPT